MRRVGIAALVTVGALAGAGPALGAATPIAPPNGGNVGPNIHPTFQWGLPSNERSSLLSVASKPNVTPEGRFFVENVETSKALDPAQTSWTSEQPIPAGTHWWIVRTYDAGSFVERSTAPVAFTITPVLARPKLHITRYFFTRKIGVDVTVAGNVGSARVTAAAYKGRKRVGRTSEFFRFLDPTRSSTRFLTMKIHKHRARRLKLVVTVRSGSAKVTRKKRVRGV
jgi:hypothetical protein